MGCKFLALRAFTLASVSILQDARTWKPRDSLRDQASCLIQRFKEVSGIPGISVVVSRNGKIIYSEGFGYTDVELFTPVHADSVFRVGSISKSLTSLIVGRLLDQGKVDLNEDIRTYLPEFPEKRVAGQYAKITIGNLMNHTSGIRSYLETKNPDDNRKYCPEMFLNKRYSSSLEACDIFKADALVHAPGEKYTYSTFGFTLLSAVIEAVSAKKGPAFGRKTSGQNSSSASENPNGHKTLPKWALFETQFKQLFKELGLRNTSLDTSETVIANRTRQYRRSASGRLENTPAVDQSYKYAGGGLLSSANDLVVVANHLAAIYLSQGDGVISGGALDRLWRESVPADMELPSAEYRPGLAWFLWRRTIYSAGSRCGHRLHVSHTGGSVGGAACLVISLPCRCETPGGERLSADSRLSADYHLTGGDSRSTTPRDTVCVAVLVNLEEASGIQQLADSLADLFFRATLEDTDTAPDNDAHTISSGRYSLTVVASKLPVQPIS